MLFLLIISLFYDAGTVFECVKPILRQFYAKFFINLAAKSDSFPPVTDRAGTVNAKNHKFLRKIHICTCACVKFGLCVKFVFRVFNFLLLEKMRVRAKLSKICNAPVLYAKNSTLAGLYVFKSL